MRLFGRGRAFLFAGMLGLAPVMAIAAPRPPVRQVVIVDADAGDDIDDAYALSWALRSRRLDVRAVISAFGDTYLRDRMIRRMLATLGREDVSLGHGVATKPATVFTQQAWAAGGPAGRAPDGITLALDLIRRNPGRITLIALAPLTNIRAMIARDPATFARLKAVLVMGGSIRRGYVGKPTPDVEYNVAQDPEGLRALLASGVPVTLFPLDSTQVRLERPLPPADPATAMLATLTDQWRALNPWKQTVPTLFDAVPVAAAIDPALCPSTPIRIAVDDKGFTLPIAGPPNARVCLASDAPAILARLTADLSAAAAPAARARNPHRSAARPPRRRS